jgi:hypothetical protein
MDHASAPMQEAMGIYLNITKASAVLRSPAARNATVTADAAWDDRSPANILKRVGEILMIP